MSAWIPRADTDYTPGKIQISSFGKTNQNKNLHATQVSIMVTKVNDKQ